MQKDIILFVGAFPEAAATAVRKHAKREKFPYRIALIRDSDYLRKQRLAEPGGSSDDYDILIECDLDDPIKITKALLPYQDEFLAITCRGEAHIASLAKIMPHVPYLKGPTSMSLLWSTDKLSMRRRLTAFDKKISPNYTVVTDARASSLKKIKEKVGFPLVVKPTGLAASLLVTLCFHEDELAKTLRTVFQRIRKIYRENNREAIPQVLVEQFMEGEMYSIDVYVNSRGKMYYCPMVHVKTGRTIGFEDFFGYLQMTPTLLKKESIAAAEEVAAKAVHALALRSTTAHIELMRLETGWKVIELGPRVGGFRHKMYELSYGMDHSWNDILIHIPRTPIIPRKIKGYSATMKFFAKEEGILTQLKGIQRIQRLKSCVDVKVNKKIGDKCLYAKNGGKCVLELTVFNPSRSELLADVRRAEQELVIKTVKSARSVKTVKSA